MAGLYSMATSGRVLVLQREINHYNSTTGNLYLKKGTVSTIELPDRQNQRNISRIPPGTYPFQKITRSNGNKAIWIRDVPNRSEILIHQGTKPSHSQGCILTKDMTWLNEIETKGLITILD